MQRVRTGIQEQKVDAGQSRRALTSIRVWMVRYPPQLLDLLRFLGTSRPRNISGRQLSSTASILVVPETSYLMTIALTESLMGIKLEK